MGLIDPTNPLYNTIIFYIIIIIVLLLIKPDSMYCNKTKRFKSFGIGENKTICSFPMVCMTSAVGLYIIFLIIEILNGYLEEKNIDLLD